MVNGTGSVYINLETDTIDISDLMDSADVNFVVVSHPDHLNKNMIMISRIDASAKTLLTDLTSLGYVLYKNDQFSSSFVHQRHIPKLWHRISNGEFTVSDDGVIYTYTPPSIETKTPKLLVVFSSIHEDMYSSSLGRFFKHNFPTIQKFIAPETGILRIADMGGITGAFYLDTVANPNNSKSIQSLIISVSNRENVAKEDIVLYGGSKGATGALYHSLVLDVKCIAVDPVVSDEYYEKKYRDSHFTAGGIFPRTKQEVFSELAYSSRKATHNSDDGARRVIVCSTKSPQFFFIEKILLDALSGDAAFFNCMHPLIRDHPDVGPRSLPMTTSLINSALYGLTIPFGFQSFV